MQNLELNLNRKRLFYTKSRIFGLYYPMKCQANPEIVKIAPVIKPNGDHIKSNDYTIEQLPVIVGQCGPSSSEDG
jgi:hypothetical protein